MASRMPHLITNFKFTDDPQMLLYKLKICISYLLYNVPKKISSFDKIQLKDKLVILYTKLTLFENGQN